MAQGKKSFTAYCDWIETFNSLPDDKAGQLIKHLLAYVNDENPETEDILIKAVFAQIKATLKRDLKKWEDKREQNRENARKRWNKKDANVCERIKTDANNAVSDSVRVSVSDSVRVSVSDSVSSNKLDDDVLYNIDELKKYYLGKKEICDAVISNKENKINDLKDLEQKLNLFNEYLKQQGRLSEKFKEYGMYFRNCCKKDMFKNNGKKTTIVKNDYNDIYGTN